MSPPFSADRYAANIHGRWRVQHVNRLPQYLDRTTRPIKRSDAEPLTREDLQYDLLYYIFADTTKAFVDYLAPGHPIVNFCDLYVNTLYNSPNCSRVLKNSMIETPAFAIEYAKIALLTNVGRINTTMACTKTALRNYHPVPSLQKTNGNLQDAVRIKKCLKTALLPFESKNPPLSSPAEILDKAICTGYIPPTSIVNLIFVLSDSNHAMTVAQKHFDPPIEFLDLFLPINLSSASRARAFLWVMYHYLFGPECQNPFEDEYSRANPGRAPHMRALTRRDQAKENVDLVAEIEWGKHMGTLRTRFLRELVEEMQQEKSRKKNLPSSPSVSVAAMDQQAHTQMYGTLDGPGSRGLLHSHESRPIGTSTYEPSSWPLPQLEMFMDHNQEHSMLNQAWHVINACDPLEDSDKDSDEHVRLDYNRRLRVLARLRGKEPTPEPEPPAGSSSQGDAGPSGRLQHVQSWR